MLGSALVLALLLQSQIIYVVITPDESPVPMSVAEAQTLRAKLLKDGSNPKLLAALTWTLGTMQTVPPANNLEPHDLERERWQRQPAQKPIPDPF